MSQVADLRSRFRSVTLMVLFAGLALMALVACATDTGPQVKPPAQAPETAGQCPERRETERAPDRYYSRTNPLPNTAEHIERGRMLYEKDSRPAACASCHGVTGDGRGPAGSVLVPPPRNFACAETMERLTDGQLYWVIENGSGEFHLPARQGAQEIERPGRRNRFTAMRAHKESLSETDIWELVMYLRTLSRQGSQPVSEAQ